MKVSVNWLQQFTTIDISVDELVEKIGSQLGAVEEVIDLGKKYQGVIIGKVVECDKHPNADRLNVCLIDDGGAVTNVERNEHGLVQVVCGAPNVRAGITVAWLPPGSTVPASFNDNEPFVLSARELRGVVSNGMLASSQELAIADDHSGIVELSDDFSAGSKFAEAYQLDDYIIDIENKMFTHRPDCFGLLGVAREVAGIQHKKFQSPDWYLQALDRIKPGKNKIDLKLINGAPDLVPRFMAVAMDNVTVKQSPFALQTYLSRVGLRPINNIVDMTNYLMYLTGQPLHAYDADKLEKYGPLSLETRMSRSGESLRLLNGKTVEFTDDQTLLITSNDTPVGVAGIMGGAETESDETTTRVVIECANFDMYAIRRASTKHGIFSDAVTRFNKGQSYLQNERILEEAVVLSTSLTGGHVASKIIDIHNSLTSAQSVRTTAQFINSRLGTELGAEEMIKLLTNVEFIVHQHANELIIEPPFWRTDIAIAEDVVEEIGRLYGLERLPRSLPMRNLTPAPVNPGLEKKRELRQLLSRLGANEVLTYSFVHGNLLAKSSQDVSNAYRLTNAISPELQYYRLSLTPSLIEKVHTNIKSGFNELALFEFGKVHGKSEIDAEGLPKELERVALIIAKDERSSSQQESASAYYVAKRYAEAVLLGRNLTFTLLKDADSMNHVMFEQMLAPYEPLKSAVIYENDVPLGVVGEFKQTVSQSFKLPSFTAGFELFFRPLLQPSASPYSPITRFPKVTQDVTLEVPSETNYADVLYAVKTAITLPEKMEVVFDPLDIYQADNSQVKRISFRAVVSSHARTLKADEVNTMLDDMAANLPVELAATRV